DGGGGADPVADLDAVTARGVFLSVATRRHVEPPPPHPLEPALDPRPGLEARGVEAFGWRQLDGEADRSGNGNRFLLHHNAFGSFSTGSAAKPSSSMRSDRFRRARKFSKAACAVISTISRGVKCRRRSANCSSVTSFGEIVTISA